MIQTPIDRFVARGTVSRDDVSVPVTISGTYSAFDYDPVECTILSDTGSLPSGSDPWAETLPVQIQGKTEDGEMIWISNLSNPSIRYARDQVSWKSTADFFTKGDLDDFDSSMGEILCSVFLPPTPLAMADVRYVRSYDGTIHFDETYKRGERRGIKWNTRLGEAELIEKYNYLDDKLGLDTASIQIQRCQITIKIKEAGIVSLKDVLSDLRDALDGTFWLLSFLSRKRIAWYSAEAVFIPRQDSKQRFRKAIARRNVWLGHGSQRERDPSWLDLLITPATLRDGLFQKLLSSYEKSSYRKLIRRTMTHIIVSYERSYFESHVGNAYSAIECLVDGLSLEYEHEKSFLLEFERFGPLAQKLKQVIGDEVTEQDVARSLIKNLEKLNRSTSPSSFTDKLWALLNKHNVPVTKLWPPGADIQSELREIRRRRDLYIHQGRLDDVDQYLLDFVRLRNLAELWILSLLDCPETAVCQHGLNNIISIDKP